METLGAVVVVIVPVARRPRCPAGVVPLRWRVTVKVSSASTLVSPLTETVTVGWSRRRRRSRCWARACSRCGGGGRAVGGVHPAVVRKSLGCERLTVKVKFLVPLLPSAARSGRDGDRSCRRCDRAGGGGRGRRGVGAADVGEGDGEGLVGLDLGVAADGLTVTVWLVSPAAKVTVWARAV